MKQAYIIGLLVISLAIGFTLWAFSSAMTPYVTIAAARQSDTPVQVRGTILRDKAHTPHYDKEHNALRFWIQDPKGERIEVIYKGGKPEAFDEATETAAHGMVKDGIFYSDKLVVKCPSKYDDEKAAKPGAGGIAPSSGSRYYQPPKNEFEEQENREKGKGDSASPTPNTKIENLAPTPGGGS